MTTVKFGVAAEALHLTLSAGERETIAGQMQRIGGQPHHPATGR
jgi:hypothetical protein